MSWGEAMIAEAEERAYLERQIARIKSLEEPTAKQLTAMRTAMAALADIERRQAKRAATERLSRVAERPRCRYPVEEGGEDGDCSCPEPCIIVRVFAELKNPRPNTMALADRRHQLGRRWVQASIRLVRAEHPDWDTFAVTRQAGLGGDRPWRFREEWRRLGGDSHRSLTPEEYDKLSELLDHEQAELEKVEACVRELESVAEQAA